MELRFVRPPMGRRRCRERGVRRPRPSLRDRTGHPPRALKSIPYVLSTFSTLVFAFFLRNISRSPSPTLGSVTPRYPQRVLPRNCVLGITNEVGEFFFSRDVPRLLLNKAQLKLSDGVGLR